jgi:hypothetical protein
MTQKRENAMLEVRIEKVSYSVNEKKTVNPTMRMLEFALSNAGFTEGVWLLKNPHRTRKKGAERFRAMRLDGTGIRVRCKPGGNDTCYEWTLFPPSEMDQDSVFSDLCLLHPNSMRSTRKIGAMIEEEASIIGGLFNRVVDSKPVLLTPVEKMHEEPPPFTPLVESKQEVASQLGISEEIEPPMGRISSLDLSSTKQTLSSHFAIDRALVAFWISSSGTDFIRRTAVSEGLIRLLNISGLSKKSPIYGSVKGAMRALLMACCTAGYMERMMYGENSTNGYKLTEEGKKRIEFLQSLLEDPVATQFREIEESQTKQQSANQAGPPQASDTISRLKEMIGEHESTMKEIDELGELIAELVDEAEDDELMLSGLNKALGDKVSERDALNQEVCRLEAKLESLRSSMEKKASDMRDLKADVDKLSAKKTEIESRLTTR